jgi:AcrR family transcriptional regulator
VTVTPLPNRQQQRTQRSTRALLEAAGELIAERGYENMTLAAVGERAGYSRGLVTARFGSKDKLLEALVQRITTVWTHRNVLPRTRGRSGLDAVLVILGAIREQAERDQRALRVLYALMFEALGPNAELRRHFAEFHRTMRADLAQLLRRGIRDGSVHGGTDSKAEAALVIAGLRGIAYQWALDPCDIDLAAALGYLSRTTEGRLRAGAPPSGRPR